MAIEQHQLTDESSVKAAIHPVLLTVKGGGGTLPHATEAERLFTLLVERRYYSTIVLLSVGVNLCRKRAVVMDHASLRVIRTDSEVAGSLAGADQTGRCVEVESRN